MLKKPFRGFLQKEYADNRAEYDAYGQTQPYSFREYVKMNFSRLRAKYRLTWQKKDRTL